MPSEKLSVSLIIPNYNGQQLLESNLPAVVKAAQGNEVIVVDDASTDESVVFLQEKYPEVKVVALAQNQRFALACNAGVKVAKGDIVVLLNNDVIPEINFLNPLLEKFDNPKVAAVGCAEIDPKLTPPLISGRAGGTFERGLVRHWRASDQEKTDTFWVSGGSGAFRKKLWRDLGGFDEIYSPAYQEDRDLSYRLLKRGYQLGFSPLSIVVHSHETTNQATFGKRKMDIYSHRNSFIFIWKNISDRELIGKHFIWLPYHLTVTAWKTKGTILIGFAQALLKIREIKLRRKIEKNEAQVRDREIMAKIKEII